MTKLTTLVAAATTLLSSSAGATQFVMYTPGGDDTAVERIDPIISPGTFSGHVHQVFGSNGLSPNMTYDSLRASDCTTAGDSDGNGNADDLSVYWHPALFMEANDGSGFIRLETNGHKMYYRDVGNNEAEKRQPFEFPHGFRMVAGDMFMRAPNTNVPQQGITDWQCHDATPVLGVNGGFPTGVSDCNTYPYFAGSIHFPHCWNGDDFDQSNPTAHMSYPEGDPQGGPCPSSHPIRLPHIFQEHFFDLHSVVDKVKPDSFVLAQGDDTGFGFHADFFNGWTDGAIPALLASCPYEFYGNENVGACTSFKPGSKTSDCSLKVTYKENVDTPGQALPGCNPVSSVNPAPRLAVAALNVATDQCAAAGSAPGYIASDTSSAAPAVQTPAPTTLVTSAVVTSSVSPAAYGGGVDIVYVTQVEVVTVYARGAEATPVPRKRSRVMRL